MKMEVEVVSCELVKPSSPTPHPLHDYQLSFLDQVSPLVYNPRIFFYSADQVKQSSLYITSATDISNHLKSSLSSILSLYYPLAGRLIDNKLIHCNDEGVPYVVTTVKCKLSTILQNPVPNDLNHLVPFELDKVTDVTFGVQLNVFDCGGVAIAACLSHQIADALSFITLLNNWAAIARGQLDAVATPDFMSAKLFPPRNIVGYDPRVGITRDNIICKRFVFGASDIEALRDKYSAADDDQKSLLEKQIIRTTRVEALSTFIWSRFMAATQVESALENQLYTVVHAVNLRPRMKPPLPESSFGNYYRISITLPSLNNEEECSDLVRQVRKQINKIDKDYVESIRKGKTHLDFLKGEYKRFVSGEMVSFNFTSLCKFPLYDADFGWGKPTWSGSPALTFQNLVAFVDTKCGEAIEAYVHLKIEDMAMLEADIEFQTYLSKKWT